MPSLNRRPGKPDDLELWIDASVADRAAALKDLLELADGLPQTLRPAGTPSRPEKVLAIDRSLDAATVPFAFGGGLALAYYGEPRVTVDIDINVFVPVERWKMVRDALTPLGLETDVDEAALARDREVKLDWQGTEVHLFFSHDELHAAMPAAVREVPFAGAAIPIVSPEHLTVRKASLDRTKDWLDIEAVLVATGPIDVDEIQMWLRRLNGEDDPRAKRFQQVVRRSLS